MRLGASCSFGLALLLLALDLGGCGSAEPRSDDGAGQGGSAGLGGRGDGGVSGEGGSGTSGNGGRSGGAGDAGTSGTAGTNTGGSDGGDGGDGGPGAGGGGSGGEGGDSPLTLPVFTDDYAAGVAFIPFGGSSNTLAVDGAESHTGSASLRIAVPGGASYTGGTLRATASRSLVGFDALSFWARASQAAALNVVGFGDDAGGNRAHFAEWGGVPLTTEWAKYVIPLPLPAALTAEVGLFHFAEGAENGAYTIWLDDIQYESLGGAVIADPRPGIATETLNKRVGDAAFPVNGAAVVWAVAGNPAADTAIGCSRDYFTWMSSNAEVARVDEHGVITPLAIGSADITASLGPLAASGTTSVNVVLPMDPTTVAPAPTHDPASVISLFGAAYPSVPVDTWLTPWSAPTSVLVDAFPIPGTTPAHVVKKYTLGNYAGIEFIGASGANEIDIASAGMTAFHLDVWSPDATHLTIKLHDAGADTIVGSGDDSEILFGAFAASEPPLTGTNQWVSLDIPIASFMTILGTWSGAHVAQLVLVVDGPATGGTLYVDNVYFHH